MLLFYFGDNYELKQKKIDQVLKDLKDKKPNANYIYYDSFDLSLGKLDELLQAQGLFEEKNIILFRNIFLDQDYKKWFFDNLEKINKSDSAFIFSEEKIDSKELEKIEEWAYRVEAFNLAQKKKENIFLISNYLQEKKIKNAWLFYNQIKKKEDIESIFNIFFWSFKTLALVVKNNQKDSGLKAFVYTKTKKNLKFWTEKEIEEKILSLIEIHSEHRRGNIDIENALELFILDL